MQVYDRHGHEQRFLKLFCKADLSSWEKSVNLTDVEFRDKEQHRCLNFYVRVARRSPYGETKSQPLTAIKNLRGMLRIRSRPSDRLMKYGNRDVRDF